jgi:hypothetical protein
LDIGNWILAIGNWILDMGDWRKGKNRQRYYMKLTKLVSLKENFKKSAFLWLF